MTHIIAAVKSVVEERSTPAKAYESRKSSMSNFVSLFKSSKVNQEPDSSCLILKSLQSIVSLVDKSFFALFIKSSK